MKRVLVSIGLILAIMSMGMMIPSRTHAAVSAIQQQRSGIPIPINFASPNGNFTGVFNLNRFVVRNGQIAAVGTLTGTVTNAAGQTVGAVLQTLTLSLINISATCDILHLELGPIDLNLLGLVVHVDKIVIDIDAQSGPGNLLGNLLCAVAHLLDSNGAVNAIVNLLNQILSQL